MRGKERELIVLRSDNGDTWKEHQSDARTEDLTELLIGMDEGRVIQLCPTYSKPEFNSSYGDFSSRLFRLEPKHLNRPQQYPNMYMHL